MNIELNLRGTTHVDHFIKEKENERQYVVGLSNNQEDVQYFLIGRKTPNKWFESQGLETPLYYFDPRDEGVKNVSPLTWEVMFSEQKYL